MRCCYRVGLVTLFCFLFSALPLRADDTAFEAFLDKAAEDKDFVGLAVAVVRDGQVTLMKTYGTRTVTASAPVDARTRFRIASLSKGFAGSLTGQLIAEQKISLDDKAVSYAPNFRLQGQRQSKATLEHVLSHRLGLPPYAYDNLLEAGVAPNTILNRFGEVKPICGVGSCYAYQNVGFNMVASAIEKADGVAYRDAMRALVGAVGVERYVADEGRIATRR